MKRALIIVAILFLVLIVIPVVSVALGDAAVNAVSTVYAIAICVLPVFLVVMYIKKRKLRKASTKPAPAPVVPRRTTSQRRTVTRPTPPVPDEVDDYDTGDDDDIAYRYTDVGVFAPYLDVFDHPALIEGAKISLRQEPENRHDARAVAVVVGRKRIGYLYRGRLQDMANDWIERGDAVSGRITCISPHVVDAKRDGIKIDLYFY